MTAKTLLDRYAKLEGRRAKLHQDARKALRNNGSEAL
jgi:hypothetical protein